MSYFFTKRFLKNPSLVGSMVPSSSFLIEKILSNIDFSKDLMILEFWPWDWNFTKQILAKMTPNSKIICFELDEELFKICKNINDNRLQVYQESAENITNKITQKVDTIVSSLPFWSMDIYTVESILTNSYNLLKKDWLFLQYQYFLSNKKNFTKVFDKVDLDFEVLNIPPAFIYKCQKHEN